MTIETPGDDGNGRVPHPDEPTYAVTFGRTLVNGRVVDDGLTLPVDSPTVSFLQRVATPLASNPVCGEYSASLVRGDDSNGEYEQLLAISLPENVGLPEHAHPHGEEHVEVIEGAVTVDIDGERRTLRRGESLRVKPGTAHTVRNASREVASCLLTMRPAAGLEATLTTLGGLAHDGELRQSGSPGLLQGIAFAQTVGDGTVFTAASPPVRNYVTRAFARLSRFAGSRTAAARYDDAFWVTHVEQPPELRRAR